MKSLCTVVVIVATSVFVAQARIQAIPRMPMEDQPTAYTCAGEFQQCPGVGGVNRSCVLFNSDCGVNGAGKCATGMYLCPTNKTVVHEGNNIQFDVECVADIMNCKNLGNTIWDFTASLETRLANLAQQANLTEQVYQLHNRAPAIRRLWVPEYNWLNDDLHGLRRHRSTSYPDGCGLGASWDPAMMVEVGSGIADEARALHHWFIERGRRAEGKSAWNDNAEGLTIYGPNINLVRDPRWGRAQETYGEDPCLSSHIARGYVTGMQKGDDASNPNPKYKKAAACCKHFSVYDLEQVGETITRFTYNAVVDGRNLWETYLPVFEACTREAGAAHVMCSYNSVNGVPACAQGPLMNGVLRDRWNWTGFVVSDYDAWAFIDWTHKYCPNMTCAAWTGINAGMDQEGGGQNAIDKLPEAVAMGKVTTARVAQAFTRLFRARLELGMFDPPTLVPYTNLPFSTISEEKHMKLALKAAQKAIGMYKNKNTLPLDASAYTASAATPVAAKKIAVVGPNAAATSWLQGNYAEHPSWGVVSILEGLFNQSCNAVTAPTMDATPGADYHLENDTYVNMTSGGTAAKCGAYCTSQLNCNYWTWDSARMRCWTLRNCWNRGAAVPGTYTSGARTGLSMMRSGISFVPKSTDFGYPSHDERECSQRCRAKARCTYFTYSLTTKTCYLLDSATQPTMLPMAFHYSGASPPKCSTVSFSEACQGGMQCIDPYGFNSAVKRASKADAVVLVLGLDQQMEAETHDRKTIDLPKTQYELAKLMKEATAPTGAPVICVFVHGGTMAFKSLMDDCDAILDAWYPSQEGGNAIAQVILGHYNPGSKATVTAYKDNSDLPPTMAYQDFYANYSAGRKGFTYRYFNGSVEVPFGYGLSYTNFSIGNVRIPTSIAKACDAINVTFSVTNTGPVKGDEVVQVYVKQVSATEPVPNLRLAAFLRVTLAPGMTSSHTLSVEPRFRSTVYPSVSDPILGSTVMLDGGNIEIYVGASQPNLPLAPSGSGTVQIPNGGKLDDCPLTWNGINQ